MLADLEDATLREEVEVWRAAVREDWNDMMPLLFLEHGSMFSRDVYSFPNYVWASALVAGRSWDLSNEHEQDPDRHMLVPVVDFFRDKRSLLTPGLSPNEQLPALGAFSKIPLDPGTEIIVDWSSRDTESQDDVVGVQDGPQTTHSDVHNWLERHGVKVPEVAVASFVGEDASDHWMAERSLGLVAQREFGAGEELFSLPSSLALTLSAACVRGTPASQVLCNMSHVVDYADTYGPSALALLIAVESESKDSFWAPLLHSYSPGSTPVFWSDEAVIEVETKTGKPLAPSIEHARFWFRREWNMLVPYFRHLLLHAKLETQLSNLVFARFARAMAIVVEHALKFDRLDNRTNVWGLVPGISGVDRLYGWPALHVEESDEGSRIKLNARDTIGRGSQIFLGLDQTAHPLFPLFRNLDTTADEQGTEQQLEDEQSTGRFHRRAWWNRVQQRLAAKSQAHDEL